ncbi:MAG: hypothetical protein V4532_16820 [Pseudomonadota bacterium]
MQTPRFKRSPITLVALGIGATVLVLIWSRSSETRPSPLTSPTPLGRTEQAPPTLLQSQNSTTLQPNADALASAELTSQELIELQAAVADHPQREQELARLVDYARFHKQTEQWRSLHDGPLTPARIALARSLLEVVPTHYARGELMGPQAFVMAQALIRDIEPNPQRQAARLTQEQARIEQAAPTVEQPEVQAKFDAFTIKQKAMVAAHEALPSHQQNAQQLEAAIEAERRVILGTQPANQP